jgi:hypothetical protein
VFQWTGICVHDGWGNAHMDAESNNMRGIWESWTEVPGVQAVEK